MNGHEHWSEERLLEWILDPAVGATPAPELDACGQCDAKRAELEAFLADCRASVEAAEDIDPARAERVANEVLARTTREDLGWRGDLRLLRGFVKERMSASFILRVAAASLLVHLSALPLLAYLGFFEEKRSEFDTGIELPVEAPFVEEPVEELGAVEPEALDDEIEVVEVDFAIEGAVVQARYHLKQGAPGVAQNAFGDAGTATHPVARLLAARSRLIRTGELDRSLAPDPGDASILHVLWCELLLDLFVLQGEAPGLEAALEELRALSGNGSAAGLRLEVAVLARARFYGLLDAPVGLVAELAAVDEEAELTRSLVRDALRPGAPLDRAWIEALARLLAESYGDELVDDPVVTAWLDWGE